MKFSLFTCLTALALFLCACQPASTPAPPTEKPTEAPPTATAEPTSPPTPSGPFTLTSESFDDGAEMSDKFTFSMKPQCDGENYSPALSWSNAPVETRSFAIQVIDPDGGNWLHWLQADIPADVTSLPEAPGGPEIGVKGKNNFYQDGYGGPCPPGGTHRYVFTLYALDTLLELKTGFKQKELLTAMENHILAEATLTGLRTK